MAQGSLDLEVLGWDTHHSSSHNHSLAEAGVHQTVVTLAASPQVENAVSSGLGVIAKGSLLSSSRRCLQSIKLSKKVSSLVFHLLSLWRNGKTPD